MIKGKSDFYNGEARMKYYAVKVLPASVKAQNKALLSRLEMYAGMWMNRLYGLKFIINSIYFSNVAIPQPSILNFPVSMKPAYFSS